MKIVSRISRLKFSQLLRLAGIGLRNPLLIWPTHKATIKTLLISDKLFGRAHHDHNSANAFRHALWNILICRNTIKTLKQVEEAISWAEKTTTLHENLMPNEPLEMAMDLHNNEMGRKFYLELQNASESEIIQFLKAETKEAVKIKTVEETVNLKEVLVYIEE